MSILNTAKSIVAKPTPAQLAANELAEAERALLASQSALDAAASNVSYNEARIKRLRQYLAGLEKDAVQ